MIDHVPFRHDPGRGPTMPRCCLLYYIYEQGFRFWDSALCRHPDRGDGVILAIVGIGASSFLMDRAGALTNEHARRSHQTTLRPPPRSSRAPGRSRSSGSCRSPMQSGRRSIPCAYETPFSCCSRPDTSRTSPAPGTRRRSARYFLNTIMLVSMILRCPADSCAFHAAFAFARLEFPGKQYPLTPWFWCS